MRDEGTHIKMSEGLEWVEEGDREEGTARLIEGDREEGTARLIEGDREEVGGTLDQTKQNK